MGGNGRICALVRGFETRSQSRENVAQHVGVHPGHPDPGGLGQVLEPVGRGVPVHPGTKVFRRIGPWSRPSTARSMARATASGTGYEGDLAALPANLEHPVPVLFAEIPDGGAAGFEDL